MACHSLSAGRTIRLVAYYALGQYLPSYPMPGWRAAYAVRRALARGLFAELGSDVVVKDHVHFGNGSTLRVGNRTRIGRNALIDRGVTLGQDVLMGPDVIMISSVHSIESVLVPINLQPEEFAPIVVGDDVWIGARVVVLPGVRIGNHAVVGAGAVVTKDVPEFAVVVGVPARVVGDRRVEMQSGGQGFED